MNCWWFSFLNTCYLAEPQSKCRFVFLFLFNICVSSGRKKLLQIFAIHLNQFGLESGVITSMDLNISLNGASIKTEMTYIKMVTHESRKKVCVHVHGIKGQHRFFDRASFISHMKNSCVIAIFRAQRCFCLRFKSIKQSQSNHFACTNHHFAWTDL